MGSRWVDTQRRHLQVAALKSFTGVLAVKANDAGRDVGMTSNLRLDVTREAETLRQRALGQQLSTEIIW